jgi:hypothetical protein
VAVVQDDVAAAAAVEREVGGAAFLPLEGLLADGSRVGRAVVAGLGGRWQLAAWVAAGCRIRSSTRSRRRCGVAGSRGGRAAARSGR